MSVLAYPRIHFRGRALVNPGTGNNNDIVVNIDTVNARLGPRLAAMTDDQAHAWMISGLQARSVVNHQLHWYLRCAWNYYGDATVTFPDLAITSVVGLDGRVRADGPLVGQSIRLLGSGGADTHPVICDLDPLGTALTQLFVGGLLVGDDDRPGLEVRYDTRAFSRWVLFRNASVYLGEQQYVGGGATWQFGVPGEDVTFFEGPVDPVLTELRGAVGTNRGLLVQFCFYLPEPRIPDTDLIAMFRAGDFRRNPAEVFVIGTVGVWEPQELATAPAGRLLLPRTVTPPALKAAFGPAAEALGPAVARVQADRDVVSLNLISALPEADYDRPPTRKADFGTLWLGVIPPGGGSPVPVGGPLAYDYPEYATTGGLVDIPFDPRAVDRGLLEQGSLVLMSGRFATAPMLTILGEEGSTRTVETDDRGLYLDVGQAGAISVLVREKGQPPAEDVTVSLWEFQYVTDPGGFQRRASSDLKLVESGPPLRQRLSFPPAVVFPAGRPDPLPIPVRALRPGPLALALTLDGKPPPKDDYPPPEAPYAGVRVMPEDDYSGVPTEERLSWQFLYREIFRYYHLVFPAMSQVIPFDDRARMEAAAPALVAATDPSPRHWASTQYMPRSRDLSAGKRRLLVEWAASLGHGGRPPKGRRGGKATGR